MPRPTGRRGVLRRLDGIRRSARRRLRLARDLAALRPLTDLRGDGHPEKDRIDRLRHVVVDGNPLIRLDLDQHLERRGRLALEDRLLCPTPARFLVGQRHSLDPTDEVRQRRVEHEVFERVAVRGRDELDAALAMVLAAAASCSVPISSMTTTRHVVLHGLDHHRVLQRRRRHLHSPCAADAGVRDVAIACDLVRGVNDHDSLRQIVGENARHLAQHRRLSHTRPAEEEDAPSRLDDVADDLDGAVNGSADAERQSDDLSGTVPQRADAVQGSLDTGTIVAPELADMRDHICEVLGGHLALRQHLFTAGETRFGEPTEIHDDLEQALQSVQRAHALRQVGRESPEQRFELVALLHSTIEHIDPALPHHRRREGGLLDTRDSFTKSIAVAPH